MKLVKFLTVQNIAIVAATIVVVGFLSIHQYYPQTGFIENVMDGRIWVGGECDSYPGRDGGADCISILYSWVLVFDALLAAVALIARQYIPN